MAKHRHKRETNARIPKPIQVAGSVAVMATVSAVSLGVLTANPRTDDLLVASSSTASTSISAAAATEGPVERTDIVSRSKSRLEGRQAARKAAEREERQEQRATLVAIKRADTKMWTTEELNLWSGPEKDAQKLGLLDDLEKVLLTGRKDNGRVEVVVNGKSRWVSAGYFAESKPKPEPAEPEEPTLGGACTNGSAVSGQPNILEVHRAVCAAFPEITSYGTYRGDGEHAQGIAIDIMVTGERGWQVANFLRDNYSALGISYIIFSQNIWSVDRGGEGWRGMSDRGSTTANHYDHVHVTTY
ncbi:hypothetical protein [Nocardioides piscis]|uniref:ARB-07466-like C-terminal domain-containing protein n=1 Tax=Nocardioides piscis TaxID=2714938 RepID=A0A6G7YH82_9ACTN|nr:hypothetical protein [Nocardioides piscis]QIK76026.1 hypothetical protein G7071_11855 [Nocardioides piscis]